MFRFAVLIAAVVAFSACGKDIPAHTVAQGPDSVMHMSGLKSPMGVCTECHGLHLEGGSVNGKKTPSCSTDVGTGGCHAKKW